MISKHIDQAFGAIEKYLLFIHNRAAERAIFGELEQGRDLTAYRHMNERPGPFEMCLT
jgi:hypothetical protein